MHISDDVKIEYWRQDVFDPEGEVIGLDVLMLRAYLGKADVHAFAWEEDEESLADIEALLVAAVLAMIEDGRG